MYTHTLKQAHPLPSVLYKEWIKKHVYTLFNNKNRFK